jgi:glycine oxidase
MPAKGVEPLSNSNLDSPDVAVIGGGAIGLAVAWRAAQAGLKTVVFERDEPGGATSHLAAGMLAPNAEADASEQALLSLGLASAEAWPAFARELADAAGVEPGYLRCGTILAARDADEAEALARELDLRKRLELEARRLLPSAARRLEPSLAPGLRLALELPGDHSVDPRRLTAALVAAVRRAGGDVRAKTEVAEVMVASGRIGGVALAGGERIQVEHVVVAAGPWSGQLAGLPDAARVPVRPVKGQILRLHDPRGPGLLSRVLRWAGGYIVPRGDGRYVLGATTEERGFDTTVTAGATFELLRDAMEMLPGTAELVIDELSAGLRPATPDNRPALGQGALAGLHWATGHYRGGILLAPISAELLLASLVGGPLPDFAAPFAPERFAPERFARLGAVA